MELERISLEDKLQEEMFLQDLDPQLVVAVLKDTMLNATTATPKGDLIPDYNARLAAIKTRKQLQRKWPTTAVIAKNVFMWAGDL